MDTGWIQRTAWANCSPGSNLGLNVDSDVQHGLGLPITDLVVQFFFSLTGADADAVPAPLGWMCRPVDTTAIRVHTQNTGPVYQGGGGPEPTEGQSGYYKVVVVPLSGGESSPEKRIYYDTLSQGCNYYPATVAALFAINQASAPHVIANWASQFADCLWEVHNYDSHVRSVHTFPTLADFVAWKNTNVPHGGVPDVFNQIRVRPFDIVDGTIPTIDRLYGFPNLYAALKGGRVKSGSRHMAWGQGGEGMFRAVWEYFFPFTIGLISDADFSYGANGRKACWTSKNSTRLYSMPKVGEVIKINATTPGPEYRHSACENWEGFNWINPVHSHLKIADRCFILMSEFGSGHQILQHPTGSDGRKIRKHLLWWGDHSALVAFKLWDEVSGPGERQIAVLFKPIGIDRLWLPYFDNTLYDMEIMWVNNADAQAVHFQKVPWAWFNMGSGSPPHPNSGIFLKKSYWLPPLQRLTYGLGHQKYQNRYRMYCRLRSKATKHVGALSSSCVELRVGETNAPVKLVVTRKS